MFEIQTKNKITSQGLDLFDRAKYNISEACEVPDAIIVRSANLLNENFGPGLKAIARAGAGYNNIPVDACSNCGIVVFNTPAQNANAVKELTVAALVLASRNVIDAVNWAKTLKSDVAKEVESGKAQFVGHEILGKTLGIIGMGAVGSRTANAGVALGMEVLGVDPYMTIENALSLSRSVKIAKERDDIFAKSDYIALHTTLTPETKYVINEQNIAKMKDGVRIINFTRADTVDDDAMAAALERGKVAKYVTDFPNEKVLQMKNTIAIPHLAASTEESEENCAIMAATQLIDFLENGNIKNSVNYPELIMERSTDYRICIFHKNISGAISKITSAISELGINIEHFTNRSKGDYAYTVCDINGKIPDGLLSTISGINDMIRINVIHEPI